MLACDGSVITLCACAAKKPRPAAAIRSRFGVVPRALPCPKPTASSRRGSIRDEDDVARHARRVERR